MNGELLIETPVLDSTNEWFANSERIDRWIWLIISISTHCRSDGSKKDKEQTEIYSKDIYSIVAK